jgi:hypothetical protein
MLLKRVTPVTLIREILRKLRILFTHLRVFDCDGA